MADNHDFILDNNVVIEHDEAATNESLVKYHEMTKEIIKEED